jgi:hypothetical protein
VFYEAPEEPDDFIEWTRDRTRLLLVDRTPREVFWEGQPVAEGQWDKCPNQWNLLWVLATNLKRIVDMEMTSKPLGEALRSRRNRLARLLDGPGDTLDLAIETVPRQGYKLNLGACDVVLLRVDGSGRLVEDGMPRGL